jgi:energy-coupling factor transport system permease protein
MTFILSITPSELAAGLYSVKVPYKICTIFSIAFRYIPDIGRDFENIKVSMQVRGIELDPKKASLTKRIKYYVLILMPLVITSFDRVGNISNAMDLRGYGKGKTRTYYSEREEGKADKVMKVIYCLLLLFCIYWIISRNIMPHSSKMWYPFS